MRNARLMIPVAAITSLLLAACGSSAPTSTAGSPSAEDIGLPMACAAPLPAPPGPNFQATEVPCTSRADERVQAMSNDGVALTSTLGLPKGRYVLPDTDTPTQLVVMFHGHQNDSCSWRDHLRSAAQRGAVAVAMDYSDQEDREIEGHGFVENWGWAVRSGAADSILAAQYFMDRYPSITEVFNFGTSMGGNVSGYAGYLDTAVRADCSALWDWWIATEGVHNLTEEYTGATALRDAVPLADQAVLEIEEENGGTLAEVPERYSEITNVLHAGNLSYLKGVVLTHGTNDQTVPVDQSRQMADQLRAVGVPTHLYLVAGSDHVWEGSAEPAVMRIGLDELYRLMDGGIVADGETPVSGP